MRHGTNGDTTLTSTKHSGGVLPQNGNFLTLRRYLTITFYK